MRFAAEIRRELHASGLGTMMRARYALDLSAKPEMTPAWFAGKSAQRMAAAAFKNCSQARPRTP